MLVQHIKSYCDFKLSSKSFIASKIYLILAIVISSSHCFGQTTVTIGTGTSGSSSTNTDKPIYSSGSSSTYTHSRFYQITTQSQLTSAGISSSATITQWGYYKNDGNRPAANANGSWTLNVYLKSSTATTITSANPTSYSWGTLKSGATLVYSNTITNSNMPSAAGWWLWNLSTPFTYSGTGSIECMIEWIPLNTNSRTTGAIDWRYSALTPNQVIGTNDVAAISDVSFSFYATPNRYYNTQITYQSCTIPTNYTITGGGMYCSGGAGLPVGLSNSQSGVNYQLKRNGTSVGSTVAGTGSAISFGNQTTAGNYTVSASGTGFCPSTLSGSTDIAINTTPPFVPPIAGTTSIACGSTSTLSIPVPTGGSITTILSNLYRVHTFTSSSSFVVPSGYSSSVEYLVVAGGGGGGGTTGANGGSGGGGAGGYLSGTTAVTPQSYTVTIGTGGSAGVSGTKGGNGGNSVFGSVTATGGGGGGSNSNAAGSNGGSGGGASYYTAAAGTGVALQGKNGGTTSSSNGGAGGGGAGAVGSNGSGGGSPAPGANGGVGLQNSINGTATYYSGGGAGGSYGNGAGGAGGLGGGGNSTSVPGNGSNGTANLGGGGAGASGSGTFSGGTGGSGVVIVRYTNPLGGTWSSDNTTIATVNSSTGVVTGVSAGSITIRYSVTGGGCTTEQTTTVTINPVNPTISTQPSIPAAVCSGSGSQSFSVVASGPSLTYSWRKNGTPVSNGGIISGQGTATLTLTNPTTSDAGSYDVIVSGTCGNVTSSAVTNVVNPTNPIISTQPAIPTAVCDGSGTQTFSVVASGPSLTYSWRKNGTPVTNGGVISGQGTATLTLTNPTTSDAGSYDVYITSTCGNVTSSAVTNVVNPATSISTQPTVPTEVCTGSGTQTFSVVASGLSLSYSWRKNGTPVSNGGVIAGQGTATLTLTNPTTSDAGSYDVVVSGTCGTVTSTAVTNIVNPTNPIISTQPSIPTEVCTGSGIQTFSVVAAGPSLTYSWRKDGTPVSNGGVISGQGTATLTLTSPTTADIGSYDVVVSGTCGNTTSSAVSNNVNTMSAVGTISSDQSICVGAIPSALNLTSNNGTIQWQVSNDNISYSNISGANSSSLSSSAMGSILATTYYRANVTNGACSSIQSNVVTISTPSSGTNLGNNGDQATCRVKDGSWIHFYNSGRLLVSLSCVDDLGDVDVTSYVGAPVDVVACDIPTPYYTTATLGRNWVIERDAISYPISNPIFVRLPFDANELSDLQAIANTNQNPVDNVVDINSFKLSKYSGPNNVDNDPSNNCSASGGDGGTTIHAQTGSGLVSSYASGFSVDGKYLEFSVSGFSEFWLHGSGNASPLPIEFIDATINCDQTKSNIIKWRTASEKNADYYTIEKSIDLVSWAKIGTVKAQGNSNVENQYTYTDLNKNISIIYYRISQTDFDGKSTIFGPWSSECENENSLNVYPNPNDGTFNLHISSEKYFGETQLSVSDTKGVIHHIEKIELSEGNNNYQLYLKNLSSGIYLIQIKDYENSFIPIKFVIN